MNISAEIGRACFYQDKDIQGTLPIGSVIEGTRFVRYNVGTEYEWLCLLLDFSYVYPIETDISSRRTLMVVLEYREGFKGNLISGCARVVDVEVCKEHDLSFKDPLSYYPLDRAINTQRTETDKSVVYSIPVGSVVDHVRFEGLRGNRECLVVDYHYSTNKYTLVIVLRHSEDYVGMLVQIHDGGYV